ncbi:unnamed protein product [Ectocarpus sp. CCAP 1310/34]|nr:unnamed protein product [Ectocarpus sp. CCAP 1310/34]
MGTKKGRQMGTKEERLNKETEGEKEDMGSEPPRASREEDIRETDRRFSIKGADPRDMIQQMSGSENNPTISAPSIPPYTNVAPVAASANKGKAKAKVKEGKVSSVVQVVKYDGEKEEVSGGSEEVRKGKGPEPVTQPREEEDFMSRMQSFMASLSFEEKQRFVGVPTRGERIEMQ